VSELFDLGERKRHRGQDVMSMEHVGALVFALWLKTSGLFGTILLHTFFCHVPFVVKIYLTAFIHI
jgi:hypothetical protein